MDGAFAAVPWLIAGVAVAICAYAVYRDLRWKRADKLLTIAEIVGFDESTDSDNHTTYAARYRFKVFDGRTIETREGFVRGAPPPVGQQLPLWYDRADPRTINYGQRGMGWRSYLFLAAFSAAMVGFACLFSRLVG